LLDPSFRVAPLIAELACREQVGAPSAALRPPLPLALVALADESKGMSTVSITLMYDLQVPMSLAMTFAEFNGPFMVNPVKPPYAEVFAGIANLGTVNTAGPSAAVYKVAPTDMNGDVHKPRVKGSGGRM